MKSKRPSIKDIAKAIGVSITTVSFVMNDKAEEKGISKAMTEKILKYAKKINYRPDSLAQSLRTGKSKLIVCMVEDISNYFFSKLARIIEDVAYAKGYKVIFCSNENNDERAVDLINLFKDRHIDGYIIIPTPGLEPTIRELIQDSIPVVLCDRNFKGLEVHQVTVDNYKASYQGTQHLIQNGYKNIGFITIDSQQTQMKARMEGYKDAVNEANLEQHILQISYAEKSAKQADKQLKNFMTDANNLDAIFFATYYLTQSGLEVVRNMGTTDYFDKVGIISFDDMELFEIHQPSISAIAQPYEQIAQELIETLLELMKDNSKVQLAEHKVLSNVFIERSSSQSK